MSPLELLIRQFDEQIFDIKAAICSNRISSFDEYKMLVGKLNGYLSAKESTEELQRRLDFGDDD